MKIGEVQDLIFEHKTNYEKKNSQQENQLKIKKLLRVKRKRYCSTQNHLQKILLFGKKAWRNINKILITDAAYFEMQVESLVSMDIKHDIEPVTSCRTHLNCKIN